MSVFTSLHCKRQVAAPRAYATRFEKYGKEYYVLTVSQPTEDGTDEVTFYLRPDQFEALRESLGNLVIEDSHRKGSV